MSREFRFVDDICFEDVVSASHRCHHRAGFQYLTNIDYHFFFRHYFIQFDLTGRLFNQRGLLSKMLMAYRGEEVQALAARCHYKDVALAHVNSVGDPTFLSEESVPEINEYISLERYKQSSGDTTGFQTEQIPALLQIKN